MCVLTSLRLPKLPICRFTTLCGFTLHVHNSFVLMILNMYIIIHIIHISTMHPYTKYVKGQPFLLVSKVPQVEVLLDAYSTRYKNDHNLASSHSVHMQRL